MKQLHDESGSAARLSDFAVDILQVVEANGLPEYELSLHQNQEGDEVVHFVHRSHLAHNHPRREFPRNPLRRQAGGIFSEAFKFNALPDTDTGD